MPSLNPVERVSPFSLQEERPFLACLNAAILGALHVLDLTEDLHRLNAHERILICVDTFLCEAEADGVGHFFYYGSAVLYDPVRLGLEEIGARDMRIGLERYVDRIFGGEVPPSVSARQDVLEAVGADAETEAERMVGDLSEAVVLLARWARAHQAHFRIP